MCIIKCLWGEYKNAYVFKYTSVKRVYMSMHHCTSVYLSVHECTSVCVHWCTWVYMSVHWCTWVYISVLECTLVYLSVYQCTLVYLSVHECTLVYLSVHECIYFGVTIDEHLKWSDHIERTVCKANSVNAFLRQNISSCPSHIKKMCYLAMVRPILEYSSVVWSPFTNSNIHRVEMVQHRAARFITHN